ncbi:MAG TPA: sulfurtransferase TusA family protein [Aliidongia sp.]|nr:sulfurtransferase TusA family protein [Aliidongia sp.]
MSDELDARGLKCPLPVLKARKALKAVPVGHVLTVLATDPGAPGDFEHFCRTTGNELIGTEAADDHMRIVLRRLV